MSYRFTTFRYWLCFLLMFNLSCTSRSQQNSNYKPIDYKQFGAYWYQGDAELCSYELQQARYGEIHQGNAVLIFVTEDFSKTKQVKLDHPQEHPGDKVSVLKLNFTKKFSTGVYPYSMMTSVFKPVKLEEFPHALKMTTSVQEWCGQTFMQFNHLNGRYAVKGYSYFESEGDMEQEVKDVLLEDELWTMIRLSPKQLPSGEVKMIPGGMFLRLRHQEVKAQKAVCKLESLQDTLYENQELMKYTIHYPEMERNLTIYFEKVFPYLITGWEETYRSGFGEDVKKMTTKARLKKTINMPYWEHNKNADSKYRKALGLE
jgi:hypothetical protein